MLLIFKIIPICFLRAMFGSQEWFDHARVEIHSPQHTKDIVLDVN